MKKISLKLLVLIMLFPACNSDELISLNDDPTSTTYMNWNYLFTLGVVQTANANLFWDLNYTSAMIQHLSSLYWGAGDKYFEGGSGYFRNCYEISKNFSEVIKQTGPDGKDPQMVNLYNATRVMKVFAFHRSTDLYGDIPYSEANKAYDERIFYPVYDTQRSIYLDMLNELSEAAAGFNEDYKSKIFEDQDIIYEGEVQKWRKFAYSMMLRLAMRISNVDESTAIAYIEEAIRGGVFTSNDDNAWVRMAMGPDFINQNKISFLFIQHYTTHVKLSETFVDFLRDNNDPRMMVISSGIGVWGSPDKIMDPALQKGLPNGHDTETIRDYEGVAEDVVVDSTYSRINELMLDLEDPILLQTYAEVELLMAEAAVKGWHSGDPENHYNNGVRAAMQMYDIFDASLTVRDEEVDDYLAANPYDPAIALEMIGTQYWIATFLNFYESYANWRRTEYPVLIPVDYPGNDTNGTIPRRLIFDINEVSKNEANYLEAIDRMGPDKMTTRVWWDGGN
jgi:hypothetical protein